MSDAGADVARVTPPQRSLEDLHRRSGNIISTTLQDHASSLGRVLQIEVDLNAWVTALSDRPESGQLSAARRELAFSLFAASGGMYMHAYGGLRLFLELSFAAVQFSANELLRRRWLHDRQDFSWSAALDTQEGVLSLKFVREFAEACVDEREEFADEALRQYRKCSQFMHGKHLHSASLPQNLEYASDVIADWSESAYRAARSVLFLLYSRYGAELTPLDSSVADTLEHHLSTLLSVRRTLGLPVEEI